MFHVAAKNTPLVRPPARSGLLLFMHRRGKTPFFVCLFCYLLCFSFCFFSFFSLLRRRHGATADTSPPLVSFSCRRVALDGNATSAPDSSFLLERAHAYVHTYSTGQLTSLLAHTRASLLALKPEICSLVVVTSSCFFFFPKVFFSSFFYINIWANQKNCSLVKKTNKTKTKIRPKLVRRSARASVSRTV